MASGLRDFSVTFGSRLGLVGLTLVNQSFLAWFLEPAGRGSYAACMLFAMLLTLVCVLGCDVAAIYFVASKRLSPSQVVTNMVIQGGAGCALAMALGLALMHMSLGFLNNATPTAFQLALLGFFSKATPTAFHLALLIIPTAFFGGTLVNLLGGMREFKWMGALNILQVLLQLALTVAFVVVVRGGVNGALTAVILSQVVGIILSAAVFHRKYGVRLVRPSRDALTQMLHYGFRYYFGKISNQVNCRVGEIILAFFATKEELAFFSLAAVLAGAVLMVPDTLSVVLQPRVATDKEGRAVLVAQCARVSAIICLVLLGGLALLATPVVSILFSPKFLPAVPLIRILAIGTLIMGATKLFVPYLAGTNRPGAASLSVMVGTLVNLAGQVVLMRAMGLPGAAWAMTLGYIAGALVLVRTFVRTSGLGFWQTWRFSRSDWTMLGQTIRSLRARLIPVTET